LPKQGELQTLLNNQKASLALLHSNPDVLAWNWFLYLNSPWTGSAPKTWESWKPTSAVYLPDGSKPLPWGQSPPLPAPVIAAAKQQGLDLNKPFQQPRHRNPGGWPDANRRISSTSPLPTVDEQGHLHLHPRQQPVQREWSRTAGERQEARGFPAPAAELKTSWIWIGADRDILKQLQGKYYIVNAYYLDKKGQYQVGQAALTGMHITNKLLPNWIWITFENVHNAEFTKAKLELPLAPQVKQLNSAMRAALAGQKSILANYELNGIPVPLHRSQ